MRPPEGFGKHAGMRLLLIDNYDSFTFNLLHLVASVGPRPEVRRNDSLTLGDFETECWNAVLISPGPRTPDEAGICLDLIRTYSDRLPIFGVCLGLQAIGQAMGGSVVRAPVPVHGKIARIQHAGTGLFRGIAGPFEATRYHSLVVARDTCPADLAVTAETPDGLIMALSHRSRPLHGVQFHPESVLSEHGGTIIRNFLEIAAAWNRDRRQ